MEEQKKRCSRGVKCAHPDKVGDSWLPISEFYRQTSSKDGLTSYCKVCSSQASYAWRSANPDKHRENARRWDTINWLRKTAKRANSRARSVGSLGILSAPDLLAQYDAQGHRCFYCKAGLDESTPHLDHMVALAKGGTNYPDNIVFACGFCNRAKNDHSAEEYLDWLAGVVSRWPELYKKLA